MHSLRIGLLGLGVVGSQVAERLASRRDHICERTGVDVELGRVLVRDLNKPRAFVPGEGLMTTEAAAVLEDPSIAVVVELIGGMEPARTYIERAINAGKAVVTANKEVMAHHGPELLELARQRGVDVYFEAAVGGGIPLISTFKIDLLANEISRIEAVINGTTNFIIDRMARDGASFEDALAQAQRLGYAEADPTYDVEGFDATFKLSIMSSIAFRTRIDPAQVHREGIRQLDPVDFAYAAELGYAIKLLAFARADGADVELRVHPACVPVDHLLAAVHDAYNAVVIDGDLVGTVLLYGQGAGGRPTASAVVGDIIDLVFSMRKGIDNRIAVDFSRQRRLRPMDEVVTAAYLRLHVADRAGVLADVTRVLGDLDISISSIVQKALIVEHAAAELVIMTHPARESDLRTARERLAQLPAVYAVPAYLRVLDSRR
ncbi:MAG TPA: homoserine dehydrogenase [Candidatus Dormibacteraeota bacterium]|nr:homoserine dehydrogenase [Candidatus Dormibacteraeota bacterium]